MAHVLSPVQLPDVAAVGWIPYYFKLSDVPQNAYKDTRPKAYDLLFDSGNRDPKNDLVDYAGFREIIDLHDYRGALLLKNLKIHRDANGKFTDYNRNDFARLESVGFTPLRQMVKGPPPRKEPLACWPERRGLGGSKPGLPEPMIVVTPDLVRITQGVNFRLCRFLGLGGGIMMLTFRDAPYAYMDWIITLHSDGTFRIKFHGSAVPSQKLFVDWKSPPNCTYDMIDATHQEMEGFFGAGRPAGIGRTRRAPPRNPAPLFYSAKLW